MAIFGGTGGANQLHKFVLLLSIDSELKISSKNLINLLFSDLTGSTGAEESEQDNERREEEEEEEDKGPAPHMLLQLALGKELAKSNRWEILFNVWLSKSLLIVIAFSINNKFCLEIV